MKFIQSPLKLIEIIKQASFIQEMQKKQDPSWYLGPDGKKAYEEADTLKKKVLYFYDYLLSVAKSKENNEALYKIAFVMADAMDRSALEFAGYPNILHADKNPLVAYVKNNAILIGEKYGIIYAGRLLCALHHGEDADDYCYPSRRPFQKLTYCTETDSYSDMYKIERDIIWAFCTETQDKSLIGPFSYGITLRTHTEESDETEDNSEKETN